MVMHMSGTRANGDRYPPAFTPFPVEEWEGEHLVNGGMARPARKPVAPEPEPVPAHATAPEPVREDTGRSFTGEPDPEPEPEPEPGQPPAPADAKQVWVDYAVSRGADPASAAKMTKVDLQSRYGPRL